VARDDAEERQPEDDGVTSVTQQPPVRTRRRQRLARSGFVAIWVLLLVGSLTILWFRHRSELRAIRRSLAGAEPLWLAAALLAAPLTIALTVELYRVILARLGAPLGRPRIVRAYLRSIVVGTAVPFGGPASVAVLVRGFATTGMPAADGMLAWTLGSVAGYLTFILLLIPALGLLRLEYGAPRGVLVASALLVGVFLLLLLLMIYALRGPIPGPGVRRRVPRAFDGFIEHARTHDLRPRDLLVPCALSLAVDLVGAAALYCSLRAVGQPATLSESLLGSEIAVLFTVVAPIFGGLGPVELAVTVVLEQLDIPSPTALSATLLYRVYTLWLPFVIALVGQVVDALIWGFRRLTRR
jgi:uncharacterized membrane protein YbhN (UPF0104 family)